jgi:hypothetical protein
MRRDLLTRRDPAGRDPKATAPRSGEMIVEPELDEPTWEVRQPHTGRSAMRRFDGRTRSILIAAAAAAVIVNAGAVWAYWRITGSDTAQAGSRAPVELALRSRSDLNKPLTPGMTGNLTVTVTNDSEFPIRITSVSRGAGNVVADDEHRDKGCTSPVVGMTRDEFAVSWDVERNTVGAFTIPGALLMDPGAGPACRGATFTVPVRASGTRRAR